MRHTEFMKYEAYDKTGEIKNEAGKTVLVIRRCGPTGYGYAGFVDLLANRYCELLNGEAWENGSGVVAREVDQIRDKLLRLADMKDAA